MSLEQEVAPRKFLDLASKRAAEIVNRLGFNMLAPNLIKAVHVMTEYDDQMNILNDLRLIRQ
jgi:hypothetical protein